jgi:peptidoglycan/LPS O-acetylase OafA/YrhL
VIPIVLVAVFFLTSVSQGFRTYIAGVYISLALLKVYPYFCVGFLFGLLHRKWTPPQHWRSGYFSLTMILVFPFLCPQVFTELSGSTLSGWSDPLVFFVVSSVFLFLVFLVPDRNVLLENNVGDFLGKVSYSVYLLHYPVLLLIKKLGLAHGFSGALLFVAVTLMLSELSFRFLESPARSWLRSKLYTAPKSA